MTGDVPAKYMRRNLMKFSLCLNASLVQKKSFN